jgi:DNA-directed RNA polymerase subunit RPC12/RpoP
MGREWDGIIDVLPSPDRAFVTEDGRHFHDSEITITAEWAAELHAGYRCARCLEPLHELGAFPERCPLCHFEVAKYQRQQLERQYKGVDSSIVTPGVPLAREREAMGRALYRPKGYVTMSIPKSRKRPKQ